MWRVHRVEMKDYNYLSDCLRTILEEKFPDISAKERNRIVREYDLEVLRYGYLRTDFTRTLVFLLCYTAHGDIDLIKKELIKDAINLLKDKLIYTYDLKKNICLLKDLDLKSKFDLMIGAYLLNYQINCNI